MSKKHLENLVESNMLRDSNNGLSLVTTQLYCLTQDLIKIRIIKHKCQLAQICKWCILMCLLHNARITHSHYLTPILEKINFKT